MKHFEKKEILGVVMLKGAHNIKAVAVETAKDSFTAYIGPSGVVPGPEKPDKHQQAQMDQTEHNNNVAIANRAAILEKDQALGFFPKLKKKKYIKKVLNEEFQK